LPSADTKYYLLEEYSGIDEPHKANIMALTPQAALKLDVNGLAYTTIDDYYSEKELKSKEDEFFIRQLGWIDNLDAVIKDNLGFCGLRDIALFRKIYYFPFKHIIDHIIIEAYMLKGFIEKVKPKEIVYVYNSRKRENPLNLYHWIDNGTNFYKELLSIIAPKYGFSVSSVDVSDKERAADAKPEKIRLPRRLYVNARSFVKAIFLSFKHAKYKSALKRISHNKNKLNVLFLHSGCEPHDFLIKDFLNKGANIFVKEGDAVFFENPILRKKVLALSISNDDKELIEKTASEIKKILPQIYTKGKLFEWVSQECALDVTAVLKPFMDYFFESTLTRSIIESKKLARFYKENNIDFIAARAGTDEDPVTALLGANYDNKVKSVCFEHSCGAPDFKLLCICEAGMFDVYFATDDLSMKYFQEEAPLYIKNRCLVFQEPYIFHRSAKIKKRADKDVKGAILYIPANHSYLRRYFNNMDFSATWYYKFQKELVNFFASKPDLRFIFKQAPGLTWCFESIIPYIRKKAYKNIIIEHDKIRKYLPRVEKVIIDCPTTPLFESAAFGIPLLALSRDYFPKWQPAVDHFGNSLQSFSENKEAIEKIDTFLLGDPEDYRATLPMQQRSDSYEALLKIKTAKA